jgi:hypothetical protein
MASLYDYVCAVQDTNLVDGKASTDDIRQTLGVSS